MYSYFLIDKHTTPSIRQTEITRKNIMNYIFHEEKWSISNKKSFCNLFHLLKSNFVFDFFF